MLLATLAGCAGTERPAPLPRLSIDPDRVTVSGISSGAYMAVQAHVALSRQVHGVAAVAGGPYACAGGSLETALSSCIQGTPPIDVARLAETVSARASAGQIDPVDGLADDPVLLVHGRDDAVVAAPVVQAAAALYAAIAPAARLTHDATMPFGHAWPTSTPGDCTADGTYVADCGLDLAVRIVDTLEPGARAARTPSKPGTVMAFDQAFAPGLAEAGQMAVAGYAYVPEACQVGRCGLHVVFHGCEMGAGKIGERFIGLADWHRAADAAHWVVLYPQVEASLVPLNPKGCWDWWGYTGSQYDTREGAQMRWLKAAFDRLGLG